MMKLLKNSTFWQKFNLVLAIATCIIISVYFYNYSIRSDVRDEYKIIETNYGKIKGVRNTTLLKKIDFYSFKGIPYAKPPIDDLRFKAPEPVDPWAPEVLDASKYRNTCLRTIKVAPDKTPKSEDCLFLNIYVPADVKPNEKLPVMFNIHGGAFSFSTGNDFWLGPDFLLEHRVIMVSSNYRLGVFGFLNLDLPEYSGNMGLKDQQLALKWVHENIEHFSGDKNRITIFGESSGSCSSHFHALSSESRKYFRNAIAMSGTTENIWAFSDKDSILNLTYKITEDLNAPQNTSEGLIEFFKTVPSEKIVDYSYDSYLTFFNRYSTLVLAPIIERKDAVRPFITEYPDEIYKNQKIETDMMFGYYYLEHSVFYDKKIPTVYDIKNMDSNFSLMLPFRNAGIALDSPEYRQIVSEVREFYFKNETIDENVTIQYLEMLSDINFAYGINKAATDYATKTSAKTFYYRFSAKTDLNVYTRKNAAAKIPKAVGHADGFCYVFRCTLLGKVYDKIINSPEEKESKIALDTVEAITRVFTNFAKYGTPNPNNENGFLPIKNETENFLDFTNDGIVIDVNPNHKAYEFWKRIKKQILNL